MSFIIPQNELVLLDTNILVYICRGKKVGQRIAKDQLLFDRKERPLISVVTEGEALSLVMKFKWGGVKTKKLHKLIRELVVVDINAEEIIKTYAEIDCYLEKVKKPAHPINQNDIWIAATTKSADAWLLTSDKHFDPLDSRFIKRVYIDPNTGESIR